MGGEPFIKLNHVWKTFKLNGVTACRDITLELNRDETVVLMGENGAGKSTLASLLEGTVFPDKGTMEMGDSGYAGLVHQKPAFAKSMTVRDMVFGGSKVLSKGLFFGKRRERDSLERILSSLNSSLDTESFMDRLAPFQQQEAELAENLLGRKRTIILDEPEFPHLERIISLLKGKGILPVLISHRIEDALTLGDRILVMNKGQIVLDKKGDEEDLRDSLLSALVSSGERCPVDRTGYGAKGKIRVIIGYHESGLWDEEARLALELNREENGYIPSLNRRMALEESWSPVDNFMIHNRRKYSTFLGFIRRSHYWQEGLSRLNRYGIVSRPEDRMKHLSGGNQKKLLLVREFHRPGNRILLSEPSTALDLVNRDFLYDLIFKAREEGKDVTVLTADPEEALTLADEIIPLFKGVRGPSLQRDECSSADLTALMGGLSL
ncbi:MAG: ATP-binding cassette domain-containing protein [Spirochaetales bacterium]|nr:ATP-binding cassette domain-containing protein [Spirochaetales bacterium]